MTYPRHVVLSGLLLFAVTTKSQAQTVEEEDIALVYGDKSFVSIATGAQQPISRAPSVATVITAEDIQSLGAVDLDEVLETVPGLHVSRSPVFYTPIYTIRGVRGTLTNPEVLMLVNGVPITSVYGGDRGLVWGGLPTDNIARIEVIRGPGSALYGADAFAGVINIITKNATNVDGSQFGTRLGSFNTWDAWTQHGKKYGDLDVAFYARAGATRGQHETINADSQTFFDGLFGTNASHAPGPVNTGYRAADLGLELGQGNWHWRTNFQARRDLESGAGVAQALDPNGRNDADRLLSTLNYHDPQIARDWDLNVDASFFYWREESHLVLFPPGAFGGSFPDGVIGNPSKWERRGRVDASTVYSGFTEQKWRFGAGLVYDDMYKIRESKNFTQTSAVAPPTPLPGGVTDVTDTTPFMRPHDRHIRYVYTQDEWGLAKDWTLTAGIRHDRYSDFGGTTNPRLALVWEAAYNLTAKLLYGSAFRAPSFSELYLENNPAAIGNPNLKPEKIRTSEAAVSWQPAPSLQFGMNVFRYEITDIIRLDSNFMYQNSGKQNGQGAEIEAAWDATKALRLSGNYSYQHSVDDATQQDAGLAPHHRLYLRADWRFTPGWSLDTQVNWVADRKREPGDTRPDIADYHTVDLTLRQKSKREAWDIAFSIHNLFNVDAREPSPAPGFIPNDLPLARRWYLLQAGYQY